MKFNKWTLGLAAVGAVSLSSTVKADEAPTFLQTAVSSTVISGYVNTSAHWDVGDTGATPPYSFSGGKADGFNVDVVKVGISKALDESEWASGYNVEMLYGPDAVGYTTTAGAASSQFALKQAYVELRAPVGNGIDLKMGLFDTIIGYEVFDAGSNPNYTRSYGYTIEPTEHTGLLASYSFASWISASVGVANTTDANINGRAGTASSYKSYMGSVTLTAPDSFGPLAGSSLYLGVVKGESTFGTTANGGDSVNWYAGTVVNTGVTGLKVGASYDYRGTVDDRAGTPSYWANAIALYGSFQASEKLSFHGRAEYTWASNGFWYGGVGSGSDSIYAITGTVQYDLWKNVMTRGEIRWDHAKDGIFGSSGDKKDNVLLAANVIYKF
jgi:hypothetical protein